jgi:hypothetical protein
MALISHLLYKWQSAIQPLKSLYQVITYPGELKMRNSTGSAATAGIGFGAALAIAISWTANKSILWAIIHGVLSWLYVIYYALTN